MGAVANLLRNPLVLVPALGRRGFLHFVPDEAYLKLCFRAYVGHDLDLNNPKTFNEKLQWLKLHDRNPLYTTLVDKCEVKKWIASRIGEEYVIPTLGVWDMADEIDFDALPERFVLKCTHDSGSTVICKDRGRFDIDSAKRKLKKALGRNFYWGGREWPYKNVKPRIIAEQFLEPDSTGDVPDYKLFRFSNGRIVTLCMTDRFTGAGLTETFFDEEWRPMELKEGGYPTRPNLPKPQRFEEMKRLADALAEGLPFVRVDFYESEGRCLFGEMTLHPKSGFERFNSEEWSVEFGRWIELPGGVAPCER